LYVDDLLISENAEKITTADMLNQHFETKDLGEVCTREFKLKRIYMVNFMLS
jgi:hypothetical protein